MLKIGIITAKYNQPKIFRRLRGSLAIQGDNAVWCQYVFSDKSKANYS